MTPRDLYSRASKNGGRYLLPRRYGGEQHADLYEPAEWLVDNGYARWLTGSFAPGIRLTGKPYNGKEAEAG